MRRGLFVSTMMFAVIVGGALGIAIQASSQGERRAAPMPSTLIFPNEPKDFAWVDQDGVPSGIPEENWIPVTEELGLIWRAVPQQPDKVVWLVLRDGVWRAADTVDFREFYPFQQGNGAQ